MQVQSILETALYVADMKRSADFYRRIFQLPTLVESDRLTALDVAGRNVLLLFQAGVTAEPSITSGGVIPPHSASGHIHFAFSILEEDQDRWAKHLENEGVLIESKVHWPEGNISIYFRDPDEHLVELMTPGFWKLQTPV